MRMKKEKDELMGVLNTQKPQLKEKFTKVKFISKKNGSGEHEKESATASAARAKEAQELKDAELYASENKCKLLQII